MNNEDEFLLSVISHFGATQQLTKSIEEMSELTQQLCKWIISHPDKSRENIVEEFVDVGIMMDQIKKIFMITDGEIETIKRNKLDRLAKRTGLISPYTNISQPFYSESDCNIALEILEFGANVEAIDNGLCIPAKIIYARKALHSDKNYVVLVGVSLLKDDGTQEFLGEFQYPSHLVLAKE